MKKVCCVCQKKLGEIPGAENENGISHGYCEECMEKEMEKMNCKHHKFIKHLQTGAYICKDCDRMAVDIAMELIDVKEKADKLTACLAAIIVSAHPECCCDFKAEEALAEYRGTNGC